MKMTAVEPVFVDTNILLAATDVSRDKHAEATRFLSFSKAQLLLSGQVLREYLVVATRPVEVNGLGMRPTDALGNAAQLQARCRLLEETSDVLKILCQLVSTLNLKGKRIHDANIAAVMITHGVHRLATLNPKDFGAFEGFTLVSIE